MHMLNSNSCDRIYISDNNLIIKSQDSRDVILLIIVYFPIIFFFIYAISTGFIFEFSIIAILVSILLFLEDFFRYFYKKKIIFNRKNCSIIIETIFGTVKKYNFLNGENIFFISTYFNIRGNLYGISLYTPERKYQISKGYYRKEDARQILDILNNWNQQGECIDNSTPKLEILT